MAKIALVTGGSDRIGKHIALTLAHLQYDIILHYFTSSEKAQQTQKEIQQLGVNCELVQADFSHPAEVIKLIESICINHPIEVLINNGSVFIKNSFAQSDYNSIDHFYNINFKAPYLLTKGFAKYVKNGIVINLLDTQISKNESQYFDYLLTKKMLAAFTCMSAYELAPGIRVNAIAPGIILPPKDKDDAYIQDLAQHIPMKKTGAPGQIGDAVKFLIQNHFITGQIIYVDGGEHLSNE